MVDDKYTKMAVQVSICIGVLFFFGMILFIVTITDNGESKPMNLSELREGIPGYKGDLPNFSNISSFPKAIVPEATGDE